MYVTIYMDDEPAGKVLDKAVATSIMCEDTLLSSSERLKLVAECRDNKYYHVEGTNTVLLHVEEGFCILTDYKVNVYNEPGVECSLPNLLSAAHYGVYQTLNAPGSNRDWVRNSATTELIGYDIKRLLHGSGCKIAGTQLEHLSWTLDEREAFKVFGPNKERDSHRVKVIISTMVELDGLINKIIESDQQRKEIEWK